MSAQRLSVLHVWDADYPWDVRVEKISRALTDAGMDVHIAARNKAWRPLREELPEATVHRMPPWRWLGKRADVALGFPAFVSPRWLKLLRNVATQTAADVIIVRDLPLCPTAIWVGRSLGIPVLLDMSQYYTGMMRVIFEAGRAKPIDYLVRNPRAVEMVERWCMPRVHGTMVVVEEAAERLRHMGVADERLAVVSNTPPRERATEARPFPQRASGEPTEVVHLGIIEIPRGVRELLEAAARLRGTEHAVRVRFIGGGRDAGVMRQHAASLGLTEREVVFAGFVPSHADALRMVAESDIGVIPQWAGDGSNYMVTNKLFDYMAAGLPVVTSDVRPSARIVREAGAGEVFRSRDVDDLVRAFQRLRDSEHRRRCGEAARAAVLDHFHWEKDASVLVECVERAARREAIGVARAERAHAGAAV